MNENELTTIGKIIILLVGIIFTPMWLYLVARFVSVAVVRSVYEGKGLYEDSRSNEEKDSE